MSTTTISDRITVTHHPDGHISVGVTVPLPLYDGGQTYDASIFDGFAGGKYNIAAAVWSIGLGERNRIPAAEFPTIQDAEIFLIALAELALRANGFYTKSGAA